MVKLDKLIKTLAKRIWTVYHKLNKKDKFYSLFVRLFLSFIAEFSYKKLNLSQILGKTKSLPWNFNDQALTKI